MAAALGPLPRDCGGVPGAALTAGASSRVTRAAEAPAWQGRLRCAVSRVLRKPCSSLCPATCHNRGKRFSFATLLEAQFGVCRGLYRTFTFAVMLCQSLCTVSRFSAVMEGRGGGEKPCV